jgi:hypothetical protein
VDKIEGMSDRSGIIPEDQLETLKSKYDDFIHQQNDQSAISEVELNISINNYTLNAFEH